ncbi:MAG: class I SAM-dependent methyltransferase [Sphaerochaetaceae bacterium]|nr:class I SAM-dependent methyltransferase [Sphaerochaetaceae bacterium]
MNINPVWLEPSEQSYYIAERWAGQGRKDLLDFGCGLGRHSIFFARRGFRVSSFDLSSEGLSHAKSWAGRERLDIDFRQADMLDLPYEGDSFDCIFAYHVISHTTTEGMSLILSQIRRILRPGGEIFLTLCSKDTWSFTDAGFPKLDANTVIRTDAGPEKGIPHFYVGLDDILDLFQGFDIRSVRHVDDCHVGGRRQNSKHYFLLASLPE